MREEGQPGDIDRRIQRELQALLALKGHPAVVQIEEVISTPTGPALVMEFAEDGSVHEFVKTHGPMDVAGVCDLGQQVAALLADAHQLGIIHRDIKPRNILRTAFGSYKVCDFGIAALTQTGEWAEQTSAISYRYASPEELHGSGATASSDVFSLGVTLLEVRTGSTNSVREVGVDLFPAVDPFDNRLRQLIGMAVARVPDSRPKNIPKTACPNMFNYPKPGYLRRSAIDGHGLIAVQ